MRTITTPRERTAHWTRMRQPPARFSGPDTSCRMPWSADCIINTSESEFSVHTPSNAVRTVWDAEAIDTSHLGFRPIQKIATIHASSGFIRGIPNNIVLSSPERGSPLMAALAFALHILGAVVWVGGMFAIYICLRPALVTLEPPQRLR